MGNCLNIQYKASVDNPALPKEGEIKFHINNSVDAALRLHIYNSYADRAVEKTARIEGDAYFTNVNGDNLGKTFTTTERTMDMWISSGDCYLFVARRYTHCGINGVAGDDGKRLEFDIAELAWSSNTIDIRLGNSNGKNASVYGDVSKLAGKAISYINVRGCFNLKGSLDDVVKGASFSGGAANNGTLYFLETNLTMNLSSLSGKANITEFAPNNLVTGDIKYLADIAETTIKFPEGTSGVNGSIEDFVSRYLAANPGTAGSRTFTYNPKGLANVTFEGVSLTENANVPNKNNAVFSWDAQGNVTWS